MSGADNILSLHAWRAAAEDLQKQRDSLRRVLRGLLDQIESLEGYSLTRDVEPYKAQACWDFAIDEANEALEDK